MWALYVVKLIFFQYFKYHQAVQEERGPRKTTRMKKLISNYREIQRGKTESAANTNEPKFDVEKDLINQQSYGDRSVLGKNILTYIFKNGVSLRQVLYSSHESSYSHNLHLQEIISTDSKVLTLAR